MANELEQQLLRLRPGDHVCPIYESEVERLSVAVPFIKQGLALGDRCIYVSDEQTSFEIAELLAKAGVDVAGHQQNGSLQLVSQRDSYLRNGEFTPQAMIDYMRKQQAKAIAEGRPAVRILGEMTWALGAEIKPESLIEYEALLNDFLRDSRSMAICQYRRACFSPQVIVDLFRTHPIVILGDVVCPHAFFEPPRMVLGQVSPAEQVDWKIAQLKQAHSAEQINQQRNALLHALVDGITDALFVKDRQGRYLLINSAGAQYFGKSVEQVVGKQDHELFTPETVSEIVDHDRRILSTGKAETFEHQGTAAGISRVWQTTKVPYRDPQGEIAGVIGIARDITESKRLQSERDSLLERLRLQIDRLPLAYILLDTGHRVLDWNPAAEKIFGFSKAEALGRVCYELINTLPLSERLQELFRRIEAGDMQSHGVNENRTKDGRTITCEWFNTPLVGTDGKFIGLISLAQDITARQRAETALKHYSDRLEVLSRRIVDIQEEERRRLARELHDEIGQILSTISVNLQVVIQGCDAAARPRLEESIAIVDQAVEQVHNLSLDLRPSMLDDLGLISTLRWFADRQAERVGFTLHFSADSTGRRLPDDVESTCYRLVQEALTNIAKHAKANQVWLTFTEHDDEVGLEIRDDGVGFDVPSALERAARGASFGVLGMEERVELLGGTIEIQSETGHGTTIRVRVPIVTR